MCFFLVMLSGSRLARSSAPVSPPREQSAPTSVAAEVQSFLRKGRYADAEAAAKRHLENIEARGAQEDLETAEALDMFADCLLRNNKDLEAVTRAERAVGIKERFLLPSDPDLATSLDILGRALLARDPERAVPLLERALEIRRKALGPDHLLVAQSLQDLGRARRAPGDWDESRRLHEEALRIREEALGPDHPLVAESLTFLSEMEVLDGDLEKAHRLLERTLEIRERALGKEHPDVVLSLRRLGEIDLRQGDYQAARASFERALDIGIRTLGSDHPKIAFIMNDLGWVIGEMGDPVQAIAVVERALEIDEKWHGPQHPSVARELDTLSILYKDLGQLEKARDLSARGLEIMEKFQGLMLSEHLTNTASILSLMGRREEARRLYERSLEAAEKYWGPRHPYLAETSLQLGRLLADMNEPSGARRTLERARKSLEETFDDEHPKLAEVLVEIAMLDRREGKREGALANALLAETIAREHLRRTARSLPDREALRYEARRVACLDVPLSILSAAPRAAAWSPAVASRTWEAVIRSRALLLDQMAERHRSFLGPGTAEIASRALASARSRYAQLLAQGPAEKDTVSYLGRLHRARAEMERAERELASNSESFRIEQDSAKSGLAAVLGSMPSGGALVSYVEYGGQRVPAGHSRGPQIPAVVPARYLAFVARDTSSAPLAVPLGLAADIDALVGAWRREVATPPKDVAALRRYAQAGEALRRAIWDPVAARLEHSRKVYVVPDGELHMVNLGTLPTGGGRYLIETGPEIINLSAERDLVRPRRQPEAASRLLVLGGADFDADPGRLVASQRAKSSGREEPAVAYRGATSECTDFRSLRFGPIPGSLAEVGEVGSLWRQAVGTRGSIVELIGAQAGEAAFKRLAPGCTAIHLATHGFRVREGCGPRTNSPPAPAQELNGGGKVVEENPLVQVGLALAGANRRSELGANSTLDDGILTAEEIATLDLRAAEWVVLSSCESGVGPVQRGEGVLGLQRAFHVAGAGNLTMSLWPVADADARLWVRNLYEARLSGLETSEAVRRASILMLEARRRLSGSAHPFFWGAFVAVGGPLAEARAGSRPRA